MTPLNGTAMNLQQFAWDSRIFNTQGHFVIKLPINLMLKSDFLVVIHFSRSSILCTQIATDYYTKELQKVDRLQLTASQS